MGSGQTPYKVIGENKIKMMEAEKVYRILFTKDGMEWSLPEGKWK